MTPDWSAQAEPVPYAKLDNPQSLNLYTYALNNPVTRVDADGHFSDPGTCASPAACRAMQAGQAAAAHAGSVLWQDGTARGEYQATAAAGITSEGRKALRAAIDAKTTPFGTSVAKVARLSRQNQLDGKSAEQLAESATRTNETLNEVGAASRVAGPALIGVSIAASAVAVAAAPRGQREITAARQSGALAGALAFGDAGAEGGAAAGAFVGGPVGALAGAVAGGLGGAIVGGIAGSQAGQNVYDWLH